MTTLTESRRGPWILRWWWLLVASFVVTVVLFVAVIVLSSGPSPLYEYRLVAPSDAIRMVNDEGWQVSERVRMTDQAVYIYRRR